MLGSVELQGGEGIGAAIEAAVARHVAGLEGAEVAIVAGGSRGASKNTLIAKVQAAHRRDPYHADPQAMEAIRFALAGLGAGAFSTRLRALYLAGEVLLNGVKRNIERQLNPGGSTFKALTSNYAAWKRRKFGFVAPITRATGDLNDHLTVRVTLKK